MRRTAVVAIAVLLATFVVGCGDDDDDNVGNGDGDGDGEASAEVDANAQADLDAAMAAFIDELQASGFDSAPDDGDEDDPLEFESEECREFEEAFPEGDNDFPGSIAEAESGSYERGGANPIEGVHFAEGAVAIVGDTDDADEVFELLESDALVPCLEDAFRSDVEADAGADPSAPEMDVDINVERGDTVDDVDAGTALVITGEIGAQGISFDFGGELQIVRRGDRLAMALLFGLGDADPGVTIEELLELLLG